MIATSLQPHADARWPAARPRADEPDISYFLRRYPATVANLGSLPGREEWLRRIWKTDATWRETAETRGGEISSEEVLVRSAPPAGCEVEAEFDVIYAGGTLGLLHAGVMACLYKRRVLVLDDRDAALPQGVWNINDAELRELERAGLLAPDESERSIVNRYRGGFVKFHDAASRIKAEPLWMKGVLDVAVEGERILSQVANKVRREGAAGCQVLDGLRFVRAYVEPHRVTIETEGAGGERRMFSARLFVDATETDSALVRQLNGGLALTHVCPTVGTIASGFARGEARDEIDFQTGEILVSTEDASDHRQLIWDGFARNRERDEYTTRLFFYDAVDSPADKSLLALFERYFETLPAYKRRGAAWRVRRPVFGYVPGFQCGRGWRAARSMSADRVLAIGDAASPSSPLRFRRIGSHIRDLRQLTRLTESALASNATDARSLSEIGTRKPRIAQTLMLAEFMRPTPKGAPSAVNETFNAMMAALHKLDERVRQELFQDRLSFGALKSLLGHTARIYPRIFARVRERLGARGTLWWLSDVFEAMRSERRTRSDDIEET